MMDSLPSRGARWSAHRRTSYRVSATDQVSSSRLIGHDMKRGGPRLRGGRTRREVPIRRRLAITRSMLRRALSRVRILPVGVQASDERIRRFFKDRSPQPHRLALQSLTALIDTAQQGVDAFLATEAFRISRHLAAQHGEVVVVAEEPSQPVQPVRQRTQHGRPERSKDFELIAKILRLLPPFMQMLDRGRLGGRGESLPTSSVDSGHTLPHARPPIVKISPLVEAVECLLHGRIHPLESLLVAKHLLPDPPLVADQFPPRLRKRSVSGPVSVSSAGPVQRLDEDLGIAHRGQRPGDVAEGEVLSSVKLSADARADQTDKSAKFLQALAGLVNHLIARGFRRSVHALPDLLDLFLGDSVDAVWKSLVDSELKRHGPVRPLSSRVASRCPLSRSLRARSLPETVSRLGW